MATNDLANVANMLGYRGPKMVKMRKQAAILPKPKIDVLDGTGCFEWFFSNTNK